MNRRKFIKVATSAVIGLAIVPESKVCQSSLTTKSLSSLQPKYYPEPNPSCTSGGSGRLKSFDPNECPVCGLQLEDCLGHACGCGRCITGYCKKCGNRHPCGCGGFSPSSSSSSSVSSSSHSSSSHSSSSSSDTPTVILDIYDLQDMEDGLGGRYILGNNIDATPTNPGHGNWDEAEWPGTTGFRPVGLFTGSFDGAGYSITGLYINRPTTNSVGLFSQTAYGSAVLKNVSLIDVEIYG